MPDKKKPKLDKNRAARFIWTDGQFTIEDGPNKKSSKTLKAKSSSKAE